MHRLPARLLAVLAAGALTAGAFAAAGPATAATGPTSRYRASHRQSVLLPTGDVVGYDSARPTDLRVRTRVGSGPGSSWRAFRVHGHTYVLPLTAMPFLGTVLDPALFDVTALAAGGDRTVRVTAAAGATPAVPGLQAGTFSAAGAKAFGAALERAAADAARSRTATRSLFGAARIGGATGGVVPRFQQQTVIFKAVGADGKPLPEGVLLYGDLDGAARASGFAFIVDGEVRISLPKGHYTFFAEADRFTGTTAESRLLTNPRFTVTGKRNQTTKLDFRTAKAQPTVALPVKTALQGRALIYDRSWKSGGIGAFVVGDGSSAIRIAPAPAPRIGTARLSTYLISTPLSGASDQYVTFFTKSGAIVKTQSHRLKAGQLAAVHERVYDDGSPNGSAFGHGVQTTTGGVGFLQEVRLPLDRTDHLYAPKGAAWQDSVIASATEANPFGGEVDDGLRTYRGGSSATADWLRQSIAPAVPAFTPADLTAGVPCAACRTADALSVTAIPFQDSFGSGHYGFLFDDSTGDLASHVQLYRDGALIDDEAGSIGVSAAVPTGAADYRVVADSVPAVAGFALGTVARTEWTFRSSSTDGAKPPKSFACTVGEGTGCRVLPMLRIVAPLPTDLRGGIGVGEHHLAFRVEPIQGAKPGSTTATVQVSFDGGGAFVDAPVTATGVNTFDAVLTNPASAVGITPLLRISGSDASGGTVTQTVHAAYRVVQ